MSTYRRLWPFLRDDRWKFLVALLLGPFVAGFTVVQPLLLKQALDEHVRIGDLDGLGKVAALYLGAVLAKFVCESSYTVILAYATEASILRLRTALFRQMLSLSQRFFERQATGQLLTRATSDIDALSEALTAGSISMLTDLMVMIGTLIAMFLLDARLALALLCVAPFVGGVIEFCRRRLRALFGEIRDALASLNAYTAERIAGIEVLQLYTQETRAALRFRGLDERHRDANVSNNYYDAFLFAFIDGIASVCAALMLWYGSTRLATGLVTVGLLWAFIDYVNKLFDPLRELSTKLTYLQRASASLEKIFWLLDVDDRITPGSRSLPEPRGHLEIRGLSFRYREDGPWILEDVDLEVRPGEVVAVVGRTGAGKSTLVRLLARVHDGYQGSIQVDGVELRDLRPESVRRAVGSVRQEVQLFRDTLRFNVTLGDPTLDPARVDEAVRLSNLDRIASRYQEGLDHTLRERGGDLSGGEGQIVALARTLARDPGIVILDEATASVDPVTEQILQDAIEQVFQTKTCLVIAHRLSTIVGADRIVVLAGGRIVEQGTHRELLALEGEYAKLYREGSGEEVGERKGA